MPLHTRRLTKLPYHRKDTYWAFGGIPVLFRSDNDERAGFWQCGQSRRSLDDIVAVQSELAGKRSIGAEAGGSLDNEAQRVARVHQELRRIGGEGKLVRGRTRCGCGTPDRNDCSLREVAMPRFPVGDVIERKLRRCRTQIHHHERRDQSLGGNLRSGPCPRNQCGWGNDSCARLWLRARLYKGCAFRQVHHLRVTVLRMRSRAAVRKQ